MKIVNRDCCRNTEVLYVESRDNPTKEELIKFCTNGRFAHLTDVEPFGKNKYKVVIWYD
jgi:hypothetical protein